MFMQTDLCQDSLIPTDSYTGVCGLKKTLKKINFGSSPTLCDDFGLVLYHMALRYKRVHFGHLMAENRILPFRHNLIQTLKISQKQNLLKC